VDAVGERIGHVGRAYRSVHAAAPARLGFLTGQDASSPVASERTRPRRTGLRRAVGIAVGIAVLVLTFVFVLPRIASYGEVWDVVKTLSWESLGALAAATVVNLVTFAPPWMVALPGMRFRQAFVVTQASTASTYVAPGGAAVGMATSFAMLRAWGFRASDVTLAVAVTGAWNQLAMLGFPAIALALLTLTGGKNAVLQTAGLIGLIVFVVAIGGFAGALSSKRLARWIGNMTARMATRALRIVRRGPVTWDGESLARFRTVAISLLQRRWHLLTLATLAGQLSQFALLLVSLRVLDVPAGAVSGVEAFAAWSLVRLLGSLPITPGGLGVVELALTSLLVGFGGNRAGVVAAVLVYRFLTIVPTIVLGLGAAATWRRHRPDPEQIPPPAQD
jgi:uncharacterized protein (TIRG00374 family)